MLIGIAFIIAAALIGAFVFLSGREPVTQPSSEADAPIGPDGFPMTNARDIEMRVGVLDRVIVPAFSGFGQQMYRRLPPGKIEALKRKITMAGLQNSWSIEKVLALKVFGLAAGVGIGFLFFVAKPGLIGMMMLGLGLFCGAYGTDFVLDRKARERQVDIQNSLPDILDQMTVCVEAGLGFDAAMHRCVLSNDNTLTKELGRALQDIRLGVSRRDALQALLNRTDVQDLRLFVRATLQAEKSGIPIAAVLRVQSDEVREKRRQAAEERAMKLPVILMVPLVLCILSGPLHRHHGSRSHPL